MQKRLTKSAKQIFSRPLKEIDFAVVDVETSGYGGDYDAILEVAAVRIRGGKIREHFSTLVHGAVVINPYAWRLHGIDVRMLDDAPRPDDVGPKLKDFIDGHVLVGHNILFDLRFLSKHFDVSDKKHCVDTIQLSRHLFPHEKKHNLKIVAERLNIVNVCHHRALADAMTTAKVFLKCLSMGRKHFKTLKDIIPHHEEKVKGEHKKRSS